MACCCMRVGGGVLSLFFCQLSDAVRGEGRNLCVRWVLSLIFLSCCVAVFSYFVIGVCVCLYLVAALGSG